MATHTSDCAVHNEPAYPNGPCDCWADVRGALDDLRKLINPRGDSPNIGWRGTVKVGDPKLSYACEHCRVEWLDGTPEPDHTNTCPVPAAIAAIASLEHMRTRRTVEGCYQHFLSYSGLDDEPMLRYAYFHGADEQCDKPTTPPL